MDKRTLIAFLIIGLIIIFYGPYLRWLNPPPPEPEFAALDSLLTDTLTAKFEDQQIAAKPHSDLSISAAPLRGEWADSIADLPERFLTVETDQYIARFTTRGARLLSWQVKPNGRYLRKNIELLHSDISAHPGFTFWTYEGPVETAKLNFALTGLDDRDEQFIRLSPGQEREIEFLSHFDSLRGVSLTYTFKGSGYDFLVELAGHNMSGTWVRDYCEVSWNGGLRFTEVDTAQDVSFSQAYTFHEGDVLESEKLGKKEKVNTTSWVTRWGAVRTKYFIAALIPELQPAKGSWIRNIVPSQPTGSHHPNLLGVGLELPLEGGSSITPVRVLIAPLDQDILDGVAPELNRTMNWGWWIIAPISKFLLWALKKVHDVVPNYGLCIIIISILLKVVIWPLTHKSYKSMSAMSKLQPKMKELREKYSKDPQRLNKEVMKLYKEEKVNPMGGCLPMLMQMPILWAFFIVLRSTIEFRRAPFFWWIDDLSMPDVIFKLPFTIPMYGAHVSLLPILMGISTYFQSKSTMTDPNQRMFLYFMPIFMTVIFNSFPSGLTLYWTLFNVLTIAQMKITPPPHLAQEKK